MNKCEPGSEMLFCPIRQFWVAEQKGEVIGFFSLNGESIEQMYVRPDHQNTGVGTALLEQDRLLSLRRLQLYTFARNNGARRFYERHGY